MQVEFLALFRRKYFESTIFEVPKTLTLLKLKTMQSKIGKYFRTFHFQTVKILSSYQDYQEYQLNKIELKI